MIRIRTSFQWPQYPTAQASDRLVNKGVVVVTSIGNSGTNGLYAAGAPGVGQKVIGVASFDNSHVRLRQFTISPDGTPIGYNSATGSPAPPTSGTYPMARTGTATSTADACSALPAGSLTSKVALIRRGTCSFYIKAINAQNAGAPAVVIYNNVPGIQSITAAGVPAVTIPVVSVSAAHGVEINNRLAAGSVDMTWTNDTGSFPNVLGGLISSFSSYGVAPDLSLKPDIGAPGGLIYSTYPIEQGSYATLSGTSMSSPHVAGAAALLLQARPNTPAQAVRSILQNSADPRAWWGNPALGFLDNVHRQGAGMLQIADAIRSTAKVEPGKLSLGESESGPAVRSLIISNEGSYDVTYGLSHAPALSTGPNTIIPSFFAGFASVGFSQLGVPVASITVPAGSTAIVDVAITANTQLADKSLYGGYIVFSPQGGEQTLRVPYSGFKGDYQSIKVLEPTANNFPWLAQVSGTSFVNRPSGATFTMTDGNNIPYFLVHLDHQSRRLRMEVFDASGKSWHRALNEEYLTRNSTASGFFSFSWDGKTTSGSKTYTVPNGQYIIKLTIEKALSDGVNPAHFESWTSPAITIARP